MKIEIDLKRLRKFNNLTQEALAQKVGKNKYTIANWENGKTAPQIDDFYKLNELLNPDGIFFLKFNQVKLD